MDRKGIPALRKDLRRGDRYVTEAGTTLEVVALTWTDSKSGKEDIDFLTAHPVKSDGTLNALNAKRVNPRLSVAQITIIKRGA